VTASRDPARNARGGGRIDRVDNEPIGASDKALASSPRFETTRRSALAIATSAGAASLTGAAGAASPCSSPAPGEPLATWANAAAGGVSNSAALKAMLYPLPTTSMMILRRGKVAFGYGDVAQSSYLASARKSILSMLYGNAVARGQISLDATISQFGVDEDDGLLPIEKSATVADLLTARSGVYHPAGSPGGLDNPPPRGSHVPGTYFYYNNWDFNVLGAIFEKATGRTVFQAFADELARPLGMQDFDLSRQRMLGFEPPRSRYLGYHFFLSCRDFAKLGQLMLNKGRWRGRQLVPRAWVETSTALHLAGSMTNGAHLGYGYLWWMPAEVRQAPAFQGSFAALGNYGQYLVVLPAVDVVVVHRRAVTDEFAIARNLGETTASPAGGETPLLPLLDKIVEGLAA